MSIQKIIHALRPFGDVLEVGFGIASQEIQKYHPRTHTLITRDPQALPWAKEHGGVKVIEDIWQNVLKELGVFDTIYFGIDPAEGDFLIRFQYSDADLNQLCSSVNEKKYLSRFLAELERNGQITKDQKDKMIKNYGLVESKPLPIKRSKEMIQFLKDCVLLHMRKGSRFSCYLRSELDDPVFFNEIAVDPFLEVHLEGKILVIEKLR